MEAASAETAEAAAAAVATAPIETGGGGEVAVLGDNTLAAINSPSRRPVKKRKATSVD